MKKEAVIMLEYAELKNVVKKNVDVVVHLFCVSKQMVYTLHLLSKNNFCVTFKRVFILGGVYL